MSSAGILYDPNANFVWNRVLRPLFWRIYSDMTVMELVVTESDLDWTIVRPPQLTDGPATGNVVAEHDRIPQGKPVVPREDLARFILESLERGSHIRQRPVIGG